MSAYSTSSVFPDLNVWIALSFTRHSHHIQAMQWLRSLDEVRLIFCRYTQLGFLRLLSTEAVMGNEVLTQVEAWKEYDGWLATGFAIYQDEPDRLEEVFRSISKQPRSSPKEWADSYLAAFSVAAGVRLVTFDRALKARAGDAILLRP
ncbi:MAG TPA: TA system VapC family ribonuclease toxin [Acidobacteriaceae bacterium]|nr:TA system VapC family ribonuclease toxin [Acidobacteriaceae bacterium]